MDKTTSVVAALKAGKQPSQLQIDAWIDKLLQSELIQVEETVSAGELESQNGKEAGRRPSAASSKPTRIIFRTRTVRLSPSDACARFSTL